MTSEAPLHRRFRPQLSLSTLLWLMVVVGMSLTWWIDRRKLEVRIQKLEGVQNGSFNSSLWSVKEVLGQPDDPTGNAGKSWCPATTSTLETLEVGFGGAVNTASIEIYETYSLGAITKIASVDRDGKETILWQGADATVPTKTANAGVLKVKLPNPAAISRLRIVLDGTAKRVGTALTPSTLTICAANHSGRLRPRPQPFTAGDQPLRQRRPLGGLGEPASDLSNWGDCGKRLEFRKILRNNAGDVSLTDKPI